MEGMERWGYAVLMLWLEGGRMVVRGDCEKISQKGAEAIRVAWVAERRARAEMRILGSWRGRVGSQLTLNFRGTISMESGIKIQRLASPRKA